MRWRTQRFGPPSFPGSRKGLHITSRCRYLLPRHSGTEIRLSSIISWTHTFIPWAGQTLLLCHDMIISWDDYRTSCEMIEDRLIKRSKKVSWDDWGSSHEMSKDRLMTRYGMVSWDDQKRLLMIFSRLITRYTILSWDDCESFLKRYIDRLMQRSVFVLLSIR